MSLTLNHDTFNLTIDAKVPAIEVCMQMLAQATRYFEHRLRLERDAEVINQAAEQRKGLAILNQISRGGVKLS